ncbi:MAG: hypothetical protein LH645_06435 [Actinomycetia bacterium]|nr:hypothetical protein [Actinomycetes bacterium]
MTTNVDGANALPPKIRALAIVLAVLLGPVRLFHYEQAFAVPAGVASQMVLKQPDNWLTRGAHQLDDALLGAVPSIGPMFRGVTMIGTSRDWGQGRT